MPHDVDSRCQHGEPSQSRPHITIQRRGTLAINRAAFEVLGFPAAVELLFDPDRRILGMRTVPTTAVNAYPVRGLGAAPTRYLIAGIAFTKYHNITTDIAQRWYAKLDEGILFIELATAGVELRSD